MDDDFKEAIIKQKYNFYSQNRKNFSQEADKIMEKILDDKELTKLDTFILFNDNPEEIKQYKTMYEFKEKAKNGTMNSDDLVELLKIAFPNEPNIQPQIYNEFISKKIVKEENNEIKSK